MKKIIFLFLAVVILIAGCSNKDSYKYADSWKSNNILAEGYEPTEDFYRHAKEADNAELASTKKIISEYYKEYDLDWGNFAGVNTIKEVDISTAKDAEDVSFRTLAMVSSYYSMYDDDTKEIYLFPAYFRVDNEQRMHALVHELMHALISTNHRNYGRLEEGVVDLYTSHFMRATGQNPRPSYIAELNVANWLVAVFGEEEVLGATREGRIESLVDKATKPGMGEKLNMALQAFSDAENVGEATEVANVVYDILTHLAINESKAEDVIPLLEYAESNYAGIGVNIDTAYFKKLLET